MTAPASTRLEGWNHAGGDLVGMATHAGASMALAAAGEAPQVLTGTSAGAIWVTCVADRLGRGWAFRDAVSWVRDQLLALRGPEDVVTRWWRNWPARAWGLVPYPWVSRVVKKHGIPLPELVLRWRAWPGWVTLAPLERRLRGLLDPAMIAKSPVPTWVSAVDVDRARIVYVPHTDPDFLSFALASASVPLVTPPRVVRGRRYCDGGVRDMAPTIRAGADRVTIIIPAARPGQDFGDHQVQPDVLAPAARRVLQPRATAGWLTQRVLGILLAELLAGDEALAGMIDRVVQADAQQPGETYRFVPRRYIQNTEAFPGISMLRFTSADVERVMLHAAQQATTAHWETAS